MTPTKEQARAAMSRIVDSMSDCTDCVTVIDYIVALESDVARKDRAIERLVWDTPLLDDCLRCPALCDKCATNAGSDACLESLREWAMREDDNA